MFGMPTDFNLKLFEQQAPKEIMESGNVDVRELVPKCGGLPKVIVEISGLLARKKYEWKERARSINNQFIQELKNNGEFSELQDLFSWMQLYFRNCPDFLKPCILYLSIFPPDLVIRRRRLVRRWVAEGYSTDSHEESAEEKGEKQFLNLLSLSIIQQPSSLGYGGTRTRIVSCQVNGFFREYIISQRMEENLVFELDGHCAVTTQRTGRHLCITEGWDRDRIVFDNIDFSKLRSLTVSGKWESFFISESMKLLRVLDLENASGVKYSDLEKISKWFPRIKFLSLRGRTEICHLPSSIGDLRQLQTLDVRHTSIKTLPVNITKLQNLQYVRAGNTTPEDQKPSTQHLPLSWFSDYCKSHHGVGVKMPPGFRKLTALHTLGVVNVSASGTKAILELKKITQLCKLGVSGINKSNSKMFFSAISDLVHLESLSLWLDKNSEGCLDDISLPPKSLQSLRSLKLHGIGDKLPEWRELFTKLTKIDLEMTTVMTDVSSVSKKEKTIADEGVIVFLGGLSELCILHIRVKQFQNGELNVKVIKNAVEDESFKNVKILEIACSSRAQVTFGKKAMNKLEQLKVDCSIGSTYKFAGLEHLPQLKEVCVKGSHDDALETDLRSQLVKHENTPALKLE